MLLWKGIMESYFIFALFPKGMSFQIVLSIKKYNLTNISLQSILVLWIKYMKPMGRYIKRCYQIRTIYLYKRTFYTLKDTIIVFIGIEKIQLLKYGYQLRVSEIPVCRTHRQLNNRHPHSSTTEQEIQKRTSCFFFCQNQKGDPMQETTQTATR